MEWEIGIIEWIQKGMGGIGRVLALPGLFFVRTQDYFTSMGLLLGALIAIPFERHFTDFQDTSNFLEKNLRAFGALAAYSLLNLLLKLPFSKGFLATASLEALLVRTFRYGLMMFLIVGVYPRIFPLYEKLVRKMGQRCQKES